MHSQASSQPHPPAFPWSLRAKNLSLEASAVNVRTVTELFHSQVASCELLQSASWECSHKFLQVMDSVAHGVPSITVKVRTLASQEPQKITKQICQKT